MVVVTRLRAAWPTHQHVNLWFPNQLVFVLACVLKSRAVFVTPPWGVHLRATRSYYLGKPISLGNCYLSAYNNQNWQKIYVIFSNKHLPETLRPRYKRNNKVIVALVKQDLASRWENKFSNYFFTSLMQNARCLQFALVINETVFFFLSHYMSALPWCWPTWHFSSITHKRQTDRKWGQEHCVCSELPESLSVFIGRYR